MYMHAYNTAIMKLSIIISTVLVYTCTATTTMPELQHPSPVNPDVLVAVKPKEKISLITDPAETIKFKRETKQPFYPTVLPKENGLPRKQHDHNSEQGRSKPILNTRKRRNMESYQKPITTEGIAKSPVLPSILKSISPNTKQHKRDIPVPLVPKHHHPEESPKDGNEGELPKNNKEVYSESHPVFQTQVHEQEHNSKINQQKRQSLPAISKQTGDLAQQQKQESLRDIELHKGDKEAKSEKHKYVSHIQAHESVTEGKNIQHHDVKTHYATQALASHKHIDKEELGNRQIPSAQNPEESLIR